MAGTAGAGSTKAERKGPGKSSPGSRGMTPCLVSSRSVPRTAGTRPARRASRWSPQCPQRTGRAGWTPQGSRTREGTPAEGRVQRGEGGRSETAARIDGHGCRGAGAGAVVLLRNVKVHTHRALAAGVEPAQRGVVSGRARRWRWGAHSAVMAWDAELAARLLSGVLIGSWRAGSAAHATRGRCVRAWRTRYLFGAAHRALRACAAGLTLRDVRLAPASAIRPRRAVGLDGASLGAEGAEIAFDRLDRRQWAVLALRARPRAARAGLGQPGGVTAELAWGALKRIVLVSAQSQVARLEG